MPRLRLVAAGVAALLSLVTAIAEPAQAGTITLTCSRTPSDQASLRQLGYGTTAQTVIHVSLDTDALTATDWATYPGDPNPPRPSVYQAKITSDMATWSTPPDEDGDFATRYLNLRTNVLNTVDPGGTSTEWNCS